jgi:hypothetical protein
VQSLEEKQLKPLVRKKARAGHKMAHLRLDVVTMALGVKRRLWRLRRWFFQVDDWKAATALAAECRAHEDLILRIACHPLPPRLRWGNSQPIMDVPIQDASLVTESVTEPEPEPISLANSERPSD